MNVPFNGEYVARFHELHRQRYGYADAKRAIEVVNVRVRRTAPTARVEEQCAALKPGAGTQAITRSKQIYCDGGWHDGNVYARDGLRPGDAFAGPAVIVEYSATTFVEPGAEVKVDGYSNLVISV